MTASVHEDLVPEIEELSREEGRALFDDASRRLLGVSGESFLAAWDRGDYADESDRMEVTKIVMLIPFAR